MRVFAVGGTKGGSGKTTLAVNLAAAWTAAGRTVLLVDTDPQRSAASWLSQQEAVQVAEHAGGGLEAPLPQLARQFQAVVVDLPPGVPD
ncbi:MAG: AAA family ATPase, partial [bacterium]|nr:AAA family ATPase [bacterium]